VQEQCLARYSKRSLEKVYTANSPVPIPCVIEISDGNIKLEPNESTLETKSTENYTV